MKSEADMAAVVVQHLATGGWDVYQEVSTGYGGAVADIVAVRGHVVAVVECKKSLNLDVIAQAWRWRRRSLAHVVWVAVPAPKRGRSGQTAEFAEHLLTQFGIGLMHVTEYAGVRERGSAAFHRKLTFDGKGMRHYLVEQQKTYAKAGSARGGHWTPFKQTCDDLRRAIEARPGITMKEAVDEIDHHYSRDSVARACLTSLIKANIIDGVDLRYDGKVPRLYLKPRERAG